MAHQFRLFPFWLLQPPWNPTYSHEHPQLFQQVTYSLPFLGFLQLSGIYTAHNSLNRLQHQCKRHHSQDLHPRSPYCPTTCWSYISSRSFNQTRSFNRTKSSKKTRSFNRFNFIYSSNNTSISISLFINFIYLTNNTKISIFSLINFIYLSKSQIS